MIYRPTKKKEGGQNQDLVPGAEDKQEETTEKLVANSPRSSCSKNQRESEASSQMPPPESYLAEEGESPPTARFLPSDSYTSSLSDCATGPSTIHTTRTTRDYDNPCEDTPSPTKQISDRSYIWTKAHKSLLLDYGHKAIGCGSTMKGRRACSKGDDFSTGDINGEIIATFCKK
jgi:hypothetical protein